MTSKIKSKLSPMFDDLIKTLQFPDHFYEILDKIIENEKRQAFESGILKWQGNELTFLATYYNRSSSNKSKLIEDRLDYLKHILNKKEMKNEI